MLQRIKPITLVAVAVALGTLASLVLRILGQTSASYMTFIVTAVVAFLPIILFGAVRLVEIVLRRR